MPTLAWRASALEDLEQIVDYIADRDWPSAVRLKDAIEACAERLHDHPFMYRPGRVAGTREAVVHPNYIIIYRVTTEVIEIVNVVHARREYP